MVSFLYLHVCALSQATDLPGIPADPSGYKPVTRSSTQVDENPSSVVDMDHR